jgi:uncharacterized protein (TIGR02147 family)
MGMNPTYDYREVIKTELDRRISRNSSYTLRSYARDLQISVSSLSLILSGKQGLSLKAAIAISQSLKLESTEHDIFLESVKSQHSRAPKARLGANEKLKALLNKHRQTEYKILSFKQISRWYHFAITEYIRSHPSAKETEISKALSLDADIVQESVQKLLEVGILSKSRSKWIIKAEIISLVSETPSRIIRDLHHEIIQKAAKSIDEQDISERDLSSLLFSFNPKDFPAIQKKLKNFRRELLNEYSTTSEESEVYCLSQQFFKISKRKGDL